LAIVTVPAFAGTRADASRTLGRQTAEQDVILLEIICVNCIDHAYTLA
jgi:hypothetical protein